MYAVCAAHLGLSISLYLTFLESRLDRPIQVFFLTYLPPINYILSDGIVLWRAWVLWNREFLLFIPPLISLACTVGITLASAIYYCVKSDKVLFGEGVLPLEVLARALDFFVIGTNLWATSLVFIRAWQHKRLLRSLSVKQTIRSNTEKTLIFLVESGGIYLFIWIVHISTSLTGSSAASSFFAGALVQFTGMYPTMIIIVVTMRRSTADILSRSVTEAHPAIEAYPAIEFTPLSPHPPQLELAGDVQTSLTYGFIEESSDATSTELSH